MKTAQVFVATLISLCASAIYAAPSVKAVFPGNEAVSSSPDGSRHVILFGPKDDIKFILTYPTKTPVDLGVDNPRFFNNPTLELFMLEGPTELLECSFPKVDMKICRSSTVGKEKRRRAWVVLKQGQWQRCFRSTLKDPMVVDGMLCVKDTAGFANIGRDQVAE